MSKDKEAEDIAYVEVRVPPRNLRRNLINKYPCGICGGVMHHSTIVSLHEPGTTKVSMVHRDCANKIAVNVGEDK